MTERNISKNLQVVKQMPPLKHRQSGVAFDIRKSDVVQWLVQQPEVLQWLFDYVNNMQRKAGAGLLIKYNPDTGTWQGVDHGRI